MIGRPSPRWLLRTAHAVLALVILSAVPGVAIASLPIPPPPTHACCAPDAPPMEGACETAPCCITKPAPKGNAVLTSLLPAPALVVALTTPLLVPAPPAETGGVRAVAARARSAPLFLLFVSFLN